MEQANPRFVAFRSSQTLRVTPLHIDTAQMAALIRPIHPAPTPTSIRFYLRQQW